MKHLLLPITAVVWYIVVYYAIYLGMIASVWFVSALSWFWIILITVLLSSLMMGLMSVLVQLPTIVNYLLSKIYNFSWLSIIVHSSAALFAMINIVYLFFLSPTPLIGGGTSTSFISGLWDYSHLRTILFFVFTMPLYISFIYAFIFEPFRMRTEFSRES